MQIDLIFTSKNISYTSKIIYRDQTLPSRICVISSFPPVKGGEATYAQDFVLAMEHFLQNEIREIHVLSHAEGNKLKGSEKRGRIQVTRLYDSLSFFGRNCAFAKILLKIMSIRPDVVHLQYSTIPDGRYGGLLGESLFILFFILKILRIPLYVTQHSVWLLDQAHERIYEKTGNKTLTRLGMWYFKAFTHFFGIMPQKLFLLVNIRNSELTKRFSQEYNIPMEKIREEVHGVWVNNDVGMTKDTKDGKIVCLGVINPSKGYEFTIQAMSSVLEEYPQASLVIAGSPPPTNYYEGKKYIRRLMEMINELKLQHSITIEDKYLSDEEFAGHIRTANLVVLPYSKVVGASGIMHLAMRYRVPIVVAGSGLLFDELSEFVPVVPPMNPKALSNEIIRILSDRHYCTLLVDKYNRYLMDHNWQGVTKNIYEEYTRATKTGRTIGD